jgi:hypothetical protein
VNVPEGKNRVAWIDVLVPADQPARDYSGRLRVTANGGFSRNVPRKNTRVPSGVVGSIELTVAADAAG